MDRAAVSASTWTTFEAWVKQRADQNSVGRKQTSKLCGVCCNFGSLHLFPYSVLIYPLFYPCFKTTSLTKTTVPELEGQPRMLDSLMLLKKRFSPKYP
ncbi:MAG: hypothetical protein AAGF23_12495, partial [Acidobacteriota bacterium]